MVKLSANMISSISIKQLPTPILHSPRLFYLVTNLNGLCLLANDLFINRFNDDVQHPFDQALSKSISPDYINKYDDAIKECVREKSFISIELLHHLSGNEHCTIYWEIAFIDGGDAENQHLQWMGFIIPDKEVTVRSTDAGGLAAIPERYKAYEYSAEGIWRVDLSVPVSVTNSPDKIIEHCKGHAFLAECNDNMARMYGFDKAEDLTGSRITDLLDFEKLETLKLFIINGFHSSNVETKEFDRNGNTIYFLNNMTGIIENGLLLRIWGTQQDITERKKAAEQVKQSELFFRALIADSLDGMLLINETGTISFSSASVVNILGYEPEDLLGKNSFDFVHPDDMDLCVSAFREELMQTPQKKFIGIRLIQKSGEWLWCMVRGHNLFNNPAVGKMLIYFCDDTFRRSTEAALIESRERFQHLIQNLNVGVIMCDAKGYILLCNQTCLEVFKFDEEELVGKSVFSPAFKITYENGKPMPQDDFPVELAIKTKKVVSNTIVGVERRGSDMVTWLQVNAQPVLEADQTIKHIICSFIDITEQRDLAHQFKRQELQKQKQLMQATIDGQEKERSEISRELHDNISQHLTTTRLYLEVAKDQTEGQPLEMIIQAHKGLMYINNEIRRLSQSLAPPELRYIGLIESIRDLCDLLKNLHAFGIKFDHHAFNEDKIPDNMKLMLFRIIQEQINNIIRHANASAITISLGANNHELNLSIADDGKGYDPQTIKKGLGLINIINRVELFDGNTEIITSPGNGCFLQVRIPLR